jgi:lipid A 3-O-deacylase
VPSRVAIHDEPGRAAAWTARLVLALLVAGSAASPASGQELPRPGVWSLTVDDDIVAGSDRYYTGGFALAWVPSPQSTPDWALRLARGFLGFTEESSIRTGYVLGQSAFTPSEITLADPPLDDRPYAGWLYATLGLDVESAHESDQLSLTLGVIGPASLAEQNQKAIHKVTGSPAPQGWDTQLHNEPGIVLTYQHLWRGLAAGTLAGLDVDLTPYVGGAAGNVYTYANAGLMLRYGKRLSSDLGPLRLQPGPPGSAFFVPASSLSWYLFAGFDGRAVARNIFLDGNTFEDSRSVDKEPLVGDMQAGAEMTWQDVRLSYTYVWRTREFKTQGLSAKFGALSLSVAF